MYAHNGYLQMAAETGIVGLAAFLAICVYFFVTVARSLLRCPDERTRSVGWAFYFGALAFLFHAMTDTNLQSLLLVNLFWIAIGAGWAARNLSAEDRADA